MRISVLECDQKLSLKVRDCARRVRMASELAEKEEYVATFGVPSSSLPSKEHHIRIVLAKYDV